jgi:hypothetical protein
MEKVHGVVMPYGEQGDFSLSFTLKSEKFVAKKWDYIIVEKLPEYKRGEFEYGFSILIKTGGRYSFYTDNGKYEVSVIGFIGEETNVNFIVGIIDKKRVIFNIKSINAVNIS